MLRGMVMVIMALDHVRDYFHYDAFFYDPTDLSNTNALLFFTRFVTHFCAPVFVFLAGTSAFFVGQRRSLKSLSTWLLKRGLWLVLVEITIIKLAWTFSFDYSIIVLQVIWALGIGMICLAGFIHLPRKWLMIVCLVGVAGHNLLDGYLPGGEIASGIWTVLHLQDFMNQGAMQVFIAYPVIPWIFVMPLGYCLGEWFRPQVEPKLRVKRLFWLGTGLLVLFLVLRILNLYGDPQTWSQQGSFTYTLLSFFNLTKYPPSLLFLLITLGPSMLFLAGVEKYQGFFADKLVVIGRVPMFFYIIHIYVIHLLAVFAAELSGFQASDMVIDFWVNYQPELKGYGFGLDMVYLIWFALILVLYPLCYWYNIYKSTHRHYWWMSYL